jgi:hypothetical protein
MGRPGTQPPERRFAADRERDALHGRSDVARVAAPQHDIDARSGMRWQLPLIARLDHDRPMGRFRRTVEIGERLEYRRDA